MKAYEVPRKSVIRYKSATYTQILFFSSLDGAYCNCFTVDNQRAYLPPMTEVEVLETDMSFEEFQELHKGK